MEPITNLKLNPENNLFKEANDKLKIIITISVFILLNISIFLYNYFNCIIINNKAK